MRLGKTVVLWIGAGFFLVALILMDSACTWNPFGNDDISGGHRSINGRVHLRDGGQPEGIYVWMEEFQVGTYTDEDGHFTLTLPSRSSQNQGASLNGIFSVFYFLANYALDSTEVIVRDGEFLYNRGDVNKDGRIVVEKTLKRFLQIKTEVNPSSVATNYANTIQVDVTLQASDTATVIVPSSINGKLGSVLLKNISTGEVIIYQFISQDQGQYKLLVGKLIKKIDMTFNLVFTPLTPGTYDVVPYLLIAHQEIPSGLINSISQNAQKLCQDYLKMPFQRETCQLVVK